MNRRLVYIGSGLLIGLALGIAIFYGFPTIQDRPSSVEPMQVLAQEMDTTPKQEQGFTTKPRGLHEGLLAPGFSLFDLNDQVVRLEDQKGKVVLLNFWATWCGPCQIEMPLFEEKYSAHRDEGFTVLAVDFDEPVDQVRAFRDDLDLSFPILLDPGGQVQRSYNILGYPSTVFIDREGLIHKIHVGIMTEEQLSSYLEELGISE